MAEKEYIERDRIVKFIETGLNDPDKVKAFGHDAVEILAEIHLAPAADVAPVVHAEWEWHTEVHGNPIDGMDEDFGYRCSNCKVKAEEYGVDGDIYEEPPTRLKYCPNCGAILDGGKHGQA